MSKGKKVAIAIGKGALYVFSRIVVLAVVIALIVVGYYTAMNTMNVRMVVKDAFEKRAQVILQPSDEPGEDAAMLEKMYTNKGLTSDTLIYDNAYSDYEITNYFHRADLGDFVIWPWQELVTLEVTDIIQDIQGSEIVDADEQPAEEAGSVENELSGESEEPEEDAAETEEGSEEQATVDEDEIEDEPQVREPPQWKNSLYEVEVVLRGDNWKINKITLLEWVYVD
ncbi:MAG: hypothetical protein ACOYJB_08555 [Christensenellaceae bacterium]|jgi:hypothetical protein